MSGIRPTRPGHVRLAAIGDLHVQTEVSAELADDLTTIHDRADVLVIAGDMTDNGRLAEFEAVASVLSLIRVPVIAVLGNHDRRCLRRTALRRILEVAGVRLLDGTGMSVPVAVAAGSPAPGSTWPGHPVPQMVMVGFAGVGGYGGGFWPDEGPLVPAYRATQAVALRARREAARLDDALQEIVTGVEARVVVLHYAPTVTTLGTEPPAKLWMLGNSVLAKVIDQYPVDLVVHGHAHLGNPEGQTPAGTPVRNVAAHVVGAPVVIELPVGGPVGPAQVFPVARHGIAR